MPLLFPALIIFITGLISALNYSPGTFLSGWDTLHPEFNFGQAFSNIIFGVFRTDQGLGAVAAHAHMSELPRIILLWLLSFALPLSFLRYSIIFLSFILGPLGVYFFIKHTLRTNSQLIALRSRAVEGSAFLGSLVYIFNLGTVQHFYVPFEMFVIQYAALPWLFLLVLIYIEKPTRLILLLFALTTFFASPMAYASVLWYVYFASLLLFLAAYSVLARNKKILRRSLFLVMITLVVNAYWILPNIYFLLNSAGNVSQAQTNKIFSDEAFLYNKEYGNILDTALLRNFLFSWSAQRDVHTTQDLMAPWKQHLANPLVLSIGYLVFIFSLAGIIIALIKKNAILLALIPSTLFSLIMVMNMNPPFEALFSLLRETSSLFREALRFPFTKFSILLMFPLSVFFGVASAQLLRLFEKIKISFVIAVLLGAGLIFYGFPMFQGQLINSRMRIAIPKEYFELFDYLSNKPADARVAPLPLSSMWGWEYYNWPVQQAQGGPAQNERGGGYQGAGFIWFGIKQPVLARDFDRWNPSNEQYFREMSTALYSRDTERIEALARKYRVSYFLLDKNVIFPGGKPNALWHYETSDTFNKSSNIKLDKRFGNLYLYKIDEFLTGRGFLQTLKNITSIGPKITGGFVDLAAQTYGDYFSSDNPDFTYFSRSLVNRYDRVDPSNVSFLDNTLLLKLGKNKGYSLTDSWKSNDIFPEFMRSSYDLSIEEQGRPFIIDDEQFIFFPVVGQPLDISTSLKVSEGCKLPLQNLDKTVTFKAKSTSSCGFITFPSAKQDFGSLLIIEARNVSGLPIRLCISEFITSRCGIYTSLDKGNSWKRYVFMIPPQPSGASGYAVHFNSVGIGKDESVNDLRFAQLVQIPYYRIANLSFVKEGYVPQLNGISSISSKEINPALYTADLSIENNKKGLVILFKAYDEGWQAYQVQNSKLKVKSFLNLAFPFIFGSEIKEHVEVNDWANGWLLDESRSMNQESRIVIVYLPQYLEYAGFALLIMTFGILSGRFLFVPKVHE